MKDKRLMLGLTDIERRQLDQRRRLKNCMYAFIAIVAVGNSVIELFL